MSLQEQCAGHQKATPSHCYIETGWRYPSEKTRRQLIYWIFKILLKLYANKYQTFISFWSNSTLISHADTHSCYFSCSLSGTKQANWQKVWQTAILAALSKLKVCKTSLSLHSQQTSLLAPDISGTFIVLTRYLNTDVKHSSLFTVFVLVFFILVLIHGWGANVMMPTTLLILHLLEYQITMVKW